MEMKPETAYHYKLWLALGQNYELDRFSVTPVAWSAGWSSHMQVASQKIAALLYPAPSADHEKDHNNAIWAALAAVRGESHYPKVYGDEAAAIEFFASHPREARTMHRMFKSMIEPNPILSELQFVQLKDGEKLVYKPSSPSIGEMLDDLEGRNGR